jgi:hypothetical protein
MNVKRLVSRVPEFVKALFVLLFIIAMYGLADAVDRLPL